MGAEQIHISATNSRNTVDFYVRLGCKLLDKPDPELYRLNLKISIYTVCLNHTKADGLRQL